MSCIEKIYIAIFQTWNRFCFRYSLMESCWTVNSKDRPTFWSLYQQLDDLLHTTAEYVRIGEINEHVYESMQL